MKKVINVIEVRATELKRGKDYLIIFERNQLTLEEAHVLAKRLHRGGAGGVVVGVKDGANRVKIIEISKEIR